VVNETDEALGDYTASLSVSEAILSRRSVRAFRNVPVESDVLRNIIHKAARAPSGTNIQPWRVYVVAGASRGALCERVGRAFDREAGEHDSEVRYYPVRWFEPYLSRRRELGWSLYGLLGIKKGEREKARAQHRRNFLFFDAPQGMIFTLHRDLKTGSWLDYGMFIQNIMLLAREAGLHTCPQAAWADYHRAIREVLPISDEETVVCGLSIGYADDNAIENTLVTPRVESGHFTTFLD